tara:strand:- start:307 stop:555 length:249 start_codon:yes stop_codon:yes gene_type:complete
MAKKTTKKKVEKTIVDLKKEVVEEVAVVKKPASKPSDITTTKVTGNFKYGLKFSDQGLAKWHLKKHGGKIYQEGNIYILKKR